MMLSLSCFFMFVSLAKLFLLDRCFFKSIVFTVLPFRKSFLRHLSLGENRGSDESKLFGWVTRLKWCSVLVGRLHKEATSCIAQPFCEQKCRDKTNKRQRFYSSKALNA